jgi:hypothetical protein
MSPPRFFSRRFDPFRVHDKRRSRYWLCSCSRCLIMNEFAPVFRAFRVLTVANRNVDVEVNPLMPRSFLMHCDEMPIERKA